MLQHSASPPSPGLDHERAEDSRRAIRWTTRGELASSLRRQPSSLPNNAPRHRGGEARVTERVARVYQQRQAASAAVSLRRSASLCPPGPRRSVVPALQQCVAAEAPRDGAGNFRLHGASMRLMQRALVESFCLN